MPTPTVAPARRFVVCGDNPLAYRLVNELVSRFGADVTVVAPRSVRDHGPQIARLPRVRIVESGRLDDDTLRAAGVADARALALVNQDDVGNIHAALRAYELNPRLRMVIRMFNTSLGHRIRTLFTDCTVLSDSAMAAPLLVAAAMGDVAPSHTRLPGRTVYVARRDEVPVERVMCGLADTTQPALRLLPADQDSADLVLAIADGSAQDRLGAPRIRRWMMFWWRLRALLNNTMVRAAVVLTGLLVAGCVLLATIGGNGWANAFYLALLDSAGAAQPDPGLSPINRVLQVCLTLLGISIIPVVTAAVVDGVVRARLAERDLTPGRIAGHVVVVGLGNIGSRVVRQLHDLGIAVVAIEADENVRGVSIARRLDVPVVIGDATRDDVLHAASVASSTALMLLTNSDVVNLESALQGRAQRDDLRVVLRLFDDDLAQRVQRNYGITISRSVSSLAASAFAAAMVERQVIATIPIGRDVLLIAEVPIVAGSPLAGEELLAAEEHGEVRVIALRPRGLLEVDWTPSQTYRLAPRDRLVVMATRAGLGRVLERSIPPSDTESTT